MVQSWDMSKDWEEGTGKISNECPVQRSWGGDRLGIYRGYVTGANVGGREDARKAESKVRL